MYKRILAAAAVMTAVCVLAAAVRVRGGLGKAVAVNTGSDMRMTVIIDAGHGGFDGGAVAPDGTFEKDINLSVAQKLDAVLRICGIKTALIRSSDCSLDTDGESIRERKVSDMHNRLAMTAQYPNAILISIHMNKFGTAQPHGAQVFYSAVPKSEELAKLIQRGITALQTDNARAIKPTTGSIFLLDRAVIPSVIVECGFLSNAADLENLKTDGYQTKLAVLIARAAAEFCGNDEVPVKGV